MNSLVLTYTPGVCVFPARSGFTPGWVYVHVGGGTACFIGPLLGTCIAGVCCVLYCTGRPHSQNTMSVCWECNLLFLCATIYSLKKLRFIVNFHWYYGCVPSSQSGVYFILLMVSGCTPWFPGTTLLLCTVL